MPTKAVARRKARGIYPRAADVRQSPGGKGRTLPEYLDKPEIDALIQAAAHPQAVLLMLMQWRAGLRVSEALAVEVADLKLESERPTLTVRQAKGGRTRVVPVHDELSSALSNAIAYGQVRHGRLIQVTRSTAWRWVRDAAERAMEIGAMSVGRKVSTHTLRHSAARHWLSSGIPINVVSRWLGHASLQTTLVYLEILPDPLGEMGRVP
jgi:integrase/recombinase XerD